MSVRKRLLFAAVTVLLFLTLVEGVSRVVWNHLEHAAQEKIRAGGAEALRNDGINFMKQVDPRYGFALKPGYTSENMVINANGFAQREPVDVQKMPGRLRVVAMGESTTMGHGVDEGNYPAHLRRLLADALGPGRSEVINTGVAGWISDQVALRAEQEMAAYDPDIVVLYVGWNDFQSYDPFGQPPNRSCFESSYGPLDFSSVSDLRSVALLTALLQHRAREEEAPLHPPPVGEPAPLRQTYRFYLQSLDRIVAAFRAGNPRVVIALCTIAARWPYGTQADFEGAQGRTYWMKAHGLTPEQSAASLARFDQLIRAYASEHDLLLVDVEGQFAGLDRARLFWDFAHMHPDGYALVAATLFDRLQEAGAIQAPPSRDRALLAARYQHGATEGAR